MLRAAATLTGALLLGTAACGDDGADTVCPAIGWLDALTVRLADHWPPDDQRSLLVTCPEPCGPPGLDGRPGSRRLAAPVPGSVASLTTSARPDSVVVSVLEDGAVVIEREFGLDWRRVGGSAECGGPGAATVTVPAP
jgi:hypothetical protein